MKLQILGSGGSMPTPRIGSYSEASILARNIGIPYKRNCSSLSIPEIEMIIDCPEDISDSLYTAGISDVSNIFITHRHPDHSFGLRMLLGSVSDPVLNTISKSINLYMPRKVYEDLTQHYPAITFYVQNKGFGTIHFLEHQESVNIGDYTISTIGYEGKDSRVNGYLIQKEKKRVLYTPCETILYQQYDIKDLDLLITECGIFSYEQIQSELSFPNMIKHIQKLDPKQTIVTHVEEIELTKWGVNYLEEMKQKYSDVNFEFAYDTLTIQL